MEFSSLGENRLVVCVFQFGETGNNTTTVTEHPNRATLPVTNLGLVGRFQLTHQVNHHVVILGQALEAGHEAGPRAFLELVQIRRINHLL